MKRLIGLTVALILLAGADPTTSRAQTGLKLGPRIGLPFGDVSDIGGNLYFGAEARVGLGSLPAPVTLNPFFDFYLTDDFAGSSLSVFAVDLNGLYEFSIEDAPAVPYAGGGIAITRISVDVQTQGPIAVDPSSTEVGLNLVGGARFPLGSVEPFAEFNFAAGAERIGLTGGLLFSLQ